MKTLIVIGIVIVAGLTNPERDQHVSEVKGIIVSNVLNNSVSHFTSHDNSEKAGSILGMKLGTVAIREMADAFVSVDDYIILSLTRMNYNEESKVVGFGAFGKVWISDDLRQGVSSLANGK